MTLPTPYYDRDGITIYHGDCREILPLLEPGSIDLVLTDPPYGINLNTDNSRFTPGARGNVSKRGHAMPNVRPIANDKKPFDPSFLTAYGKHQVIWGWHNFPDKLPRGACLVWIKKYPEAFGTFLSDAETAWMSKGHGVYCTLDLSVWAMANERQHPTQKPESLMKWCLGFFPKAQTILDPFMGSGTTLRAAKDLGRRAIGIELEERYCEIAVKRLQQQVLPLEVAK